MRISDWSSDVCSSDLHQIESLRNAHGRSLAVRAEYPRDLSRLHRAAAHQFDGVGDLWHATFVRGSMTKRKRQIVRADINAVEARNRQNRFPILQSFAGLYNSPQNGTTTRSERVCHSW